MASTFGGKATSPQDNMVAMTDLLERVQRADEVGLNVFGIGEHHRKEFLDSAPINHCSVGGSGHDQNHPAHQRRYGPECG